MPTMCPSCGESLTANPLGRPQRFCSDHCRQADRKSLSRAPNGLRYRTGRVKPKSASQCIETTVEFKPESLSPKSGLWTFPVPQAKADALSMAKGAIGEYFIIDPIRHLNELQSRVANEAAA